DVSAGLMRDPFWPKEWKTVKPGDIARFDSVSQTTTVAKGSYSYAPNWTSALNASLNYVAGSHDIKVGYQYSRRMNRQQYYSFSHYPSGLRAVYRNGAPDSVNTYNTPATAQAFLEDHGAFVQDKWRPTRKLILNVGLRMQKTKGWIPAECQV